MSPNKVMSAYRLNPAILAAMREMKQRDGVPMAVQIERAVEAWLKARGIVVKKAARKRGSTRKRT